MTRREVSSLSSNGVGVAVDVAAGEDCLDIRIVNNAHGLCSGSNLWMRFCSR